MLQNFKALAALPLITLSLTIPSGHTSSTPKKPIKARPEGGFSVSTKKIAPIKPLNMPEIAEQTEETPIATTPAPIPMSQNIVATGSHTDWMAAAGIAPGDYGYVDFIVTHESGWRSNAYNPSGAFGLCQSLPGSKMATAGADWQTNPVTQLIWCNSYAMHYGGWAASYSFWIAHSWW